MRNALRLISLVIALLASKDEALAQVSISGTVRVEPAIGHFYRYVGVPSSDGTCIQYTLACNNLVTLSSWDRSTWVGDRFCTPNPGMMSNTPNSPLVAIIVYGYRLNDRSTAQAAFLIDRRNHPSDGHELLLPACPRQR